MKPSLIFTATLVVLASSASLLSQTAPTPESLGVSSRSVAGFLDELGEEQPGAIHGMVLMRHGKVVAKGWWDPYRPEYPHMLYSLSKSFTSTAVGIAQEEGLLSIDDPVISFFPDLAPEDPSPHLKAMRIRDLLKMCSGHQEGTMPRITGEGSWVKAFLHLDVEHKPGTHFHYNTGATFMLAAIVQKVSGETLVDYLTPRLFDPLGIKDPHWSMNPEGINMGGFGLNITTEDIARFGQLLLQKGSWKGQQLVPAAWIEEATSFQASNGSNPESDWDQGYGYQFWMCKNGYYRGDGAFGQYCIVMEDLDAVLAINSGSSDMQGILNLVWEHLVPAMQEDPLPEDPDGTAMLKRKLASLRMEPLEGKKKSPLAKAVSGRTYKMDPNTLGILAATLEFDSRETHVSLVTPDGEKRFSAGFEDWVEGAMKVPIWESDQMSVSGAWTSEDTYKAELVYTETPHIAYMTFRFDEDRVFLDLGVNVSLGPTEFDQVTGKMTADMP